MILTGICRGLPDDIPRRAWSWTSTSGQQTRHRACTIASRSGGRREYDLPTHCRNCGDADPFAKGDWPAEYAALMETLGAATQVEESKEVIQAAHEPLEDSINIAP